MRLRAQMGHHGAATVEFALVAPFLVFMFVLALDFARVFYYGVVLENSARNGAYYASNYPNANYLYNDIYGYTSLSDAVLKDATGINGFSSTSNKATYSVSYGASASGSYSSTAAASSQYVKVKVTWDFNSITRFPGLSVPGMNRGVVMRMAPVLPNF